MNDTLRVRLRPSKALAVALAAGHAVAIGAAGAGLPPIAAGVAAAGLALSLVHHLRWAMQRSVRAVSGLQLDADGRLAVAGPATAWCPATLRYGVVPAAWIAIVVARDEAGRTRRALVLPDALDREAFRRLRVFLKWRALPGRDTVPVRAGDASR